MPYEEPDTEQLTKTLIDNFNILADEVQYLNDRRTILEHKLRFAHEQYQQLADKYAPSDPDILSTISKLQVPADAHSVSERAGFIPLPQRQKASPKHQTALAIRDGRKASKRLAARTLQPTESAESLKSISRSSSHARTSLARTSLSTVLEQDFTIPGKRGSLSCPFAAVADGNMGMISEGSESHTPSISPPLRDGKHHDPADPICAALYAESMPTPAPSVTASATATRCPIRFLDHHTPEEVAKYFETHKHEIPRSHEVCVKRYQRNEEDIRKLDAKYGNLVSMLQGLGQKHQAMLPTDEEQDTVEVERSSNKRVEHWANDISIDGADDQEAASGHEKDDRSSRFDRPLKEVRVGESPSRPWGISVPVIEKPMEQRTASPPSARVPNISASSIAAIPSGRCPFSHGISQAKASHKEEEHRPGTSAEENLQSDTFPFGGRKPGISDDFKEDQKPKHNEFFDRNRSKQPTFFSPPDFQESGKSLVPQMVFTGPVFIAYPFEQAVTLMQHFQEQ